MTEPGTPETPATKPPVDRPRYGERLPAPQYGEYATPQDQARAIAGSLPPISPVLGGPAQPSPVHSAPPTPAAPAPGAKAEPRKPRIWDLLLTAVLLGYGAVNVIAQIVAGSTLGSVIEQFYRAQGIGTFTPTALSQGLGVALNAITAVLFVATVFFTAWMLRRGRIAFWVPIVGGAVATVFALVFVVVLLQADPTFMTYVDKLTS